MSAPAAEDQWNAPARVDPAAAVGAGFRVFRKRYSSMLRAWLVPGLAGIVLTVAMIFLLLHSGVPEGMLLGDPAVAAGMTDEDRMRFLGISLPFQFLIVVALFAGWSLVGRVVAEEIDPDAARAPFRWGPVLALAAVSVLLYTLGLILLLVGFLVFFHWFMYAPALAGAYGHGTGDALEESRRFSKRRRTHGFTAAVLLIGLLVWVMSLLLGGTLGIMVAAMGVPEVYAGAVGGSLGQWALAPLVPALPAAFLALARREERAAQAAEALAGTDADDAEATSAAPRTPADRFRTTKCPQCGTLVPYMATGKPVDVTCPVCGRAGRVL